MVAVADAFNDVSLFSAVAKKGVMADAWPPKNGVANRAVGLGATKPDGRVCVEVGIGADVDRGIESSDRDFAGDGGIAARRDVSAL